MFQRLVIIYGFVFKSRRGHQFVASECEWVPVRILRVLLSRSVPPQIRHKILQARKKMEYGNNEH